MSLSSIRLVYNAQARFQADCLARNEEAKCRPGRTPEHTFGKEDDKRRGELAQKRGAQTLTHTQLSEYLDWYRAGIADDFRSRHEQILSQCTAPISIVTLGGGHFESLERKQSLAPSFESQAIANHRVSVYRLNQLPNLASGLDLTTCSTQELGSSLPSRVLSS